MAAAIKDATSLKMAIVRAGLKQFGDAATPPMWSLDFPAMDLFIVDEESAVRCILHVSLPSSPPRPLFYAMRFHMPSSPAPLTGEDRSDREDALLFGAQGSASERVAIVRSNSDAVLAYGCVGHSWRRGWCAGSDAPSPVRGGGQRMRARATGRFTA
eukprot:539301-Prymnesium_polylepis.1